MLKNKKVKLSIIIVNYKVEKELFNCLASIEEKIRGVDYEVIVVENDPNTNLLRKISKFNFVKYIRAPKNLGYGGGNNFGARRAGGEVLFFLNPDTKTIRGNVKKILQLFKNKKVGIVAPLLYDSSEKLYPLQGTLRLDPIRAIFSLSVINKLWPNNPIAQKYWLKQIDRNKLHEVDVVPGTAFLITAKLFAKLGGFDERFFLYFEENDLCNRVKELGLKIFMTPDLAIQHFWAVSTKKEKGINAIFKESRFYYFKKYNGRVAAYITIWLLDFNINSLLLIAAILLGTFLRVDRPNLAMFISDQGWFYNSARDLLSGNVPLVGITSSHTWLHQGAFWTYLLAPLLHLFDYDPYAGFLLANIFGVMSIVLIYKIGSDFFTKQFGIIAALLYASSPLIIIHERMAYHTAPISFFTLLLIYLILKWIHGWAIYFSLALLVMSILYNFELATVSFWSILGALLFYGYYKKKSWLKSLLNKRIIVLSTVSLLIPMIPILIYDLSNGFPQTVKFAGWLVYGPITSFLSGETSNTADFVFFIRLHTQRLILLGNDYVSLLILIAAVMAVLISSLKKIESAITVVFLFTFLPTLMFIVSKTPSEAYLPMLFAGYILSIAWLIIKIYNWDKIVAIAVLLLIVGTNAYLIYINNYLMKKPYGYGWPIENRIRATYQILKLADGKQYNLILKNPGYQISPAVENYSYLTWWKGKNPPTSKKVARKIEVFESEYEISVKLISK